MPLSGPTMRTGSGASTRLCPKDRPLSLFFFRASSYLFGGVLFLVVQFGGNSELRNSFESRPGSPLPASDGQLHALCERSLVLVRERFSAAPCRAVLLCDRSPWRRLRRILTREEGVLVPFLHGGTASISGCAVGLSAPTSCSCFHVALSISAAPAGAGGYASFVFLGHFGDLGVPGSQTVTSLAESVLCHV